MKIKEMHPHFRVDVHGCLLRGPDFIRNNAEACMRLTSMKVSAVSNWPVRRKCVAIVRSRAVTASGDENMAWYEGSGVGNLYDGCAVSMVPVDDT